MPRLVEVDEEQLASDRKLRETITRIMANPEAAVLAEQAHKKVEPNARTPHLDQMKAAVAPIEELRKEFREYIDTRKKADEEAEKQRKLDALSSQIDSNLAKLRNAGWTDEGIAEVRKIMETNGILDVDIAAAYFEKMHPPPVPMTPRGTGPWDFMAPSSEADDNIKKLIETKGDSEPLVDKMVRDVLNETRGARR